MTNANAEQKLDSSSAEQIDDGDIIKTIEQDQAGELKEQVSVPPPIPGAAKQTASPSDDLFDDPSGEHLFSSTPSRPPAPSIFDEPSLFGDGKKVVTDIGKEVGKSIPPPPPEVNKSMVDIVKSETAAEPKVSRPPAPPIERPLETPQIEIPKLENDPGLMPVNQLEPDEPEKDEEGSGLIDMRNLTAALGTSGNENVDDLLTLPSNTLPEFGAPIESNDKPRFAPWMKYAAVGAGALALCAALIATVIALTNDDQNVKADQQLKLASMLSQIEQLNDNVAAVTPENRNKESSRGAEASETGAGETPASDEKSTAEKPKKIAASDTRGQRKAKNTVVPRRAPRTPKKANRSTSTTPKSKPAAAPTPKAETAPKKSGSSELDELIGAAVKAPVKKKNTPAKATGGKSAAPLPKTLNRKQVQVGMKSVAAQVKRCGTGKARSVTMNVKISSSGRVLAANAMGALAGTPEGLCAARAMKKAKFQKFSGPSLSVKYPFKLK